jgi:alpha-tubulin suppressor-like RCC1 family protein
LRDKTLKCWGSRWDSIDPLTGLVTAPPEAPLLTGVEDVRMGDQFSCARLETSNVACWGINRDGQLGLGMRDNTIHELPVTIPNFTADEIALSDDLACGRKGGDVWCWGGLGFYSVFGASPTQVPNLHDVTQIRGGGNVVCALASDSTIWCWTADGTMSHLLDPTDADPQRLLDNVAELVMGSKAPTLFLRMKDGTVRLRGSTNNAVSDTSTVEGIVDPIRIVAGQAHQCAIMADETVRCWGSNFFGQLAVDPKLLKQSSLSVRVHL